MLLAVRIGLATIAATVSMLAAAVQGRSHAAMPVTSFGGSVPIRIAHIGRIDVDLDPTGHGSLLRVDCVGSPAVGTECFVASP